MPETTVKQIWTKKSTYACQDDSLLEITRPVVNQLALPKHHLIFVIQTN